MALASGEYLAKVSRTVVVWPAADKDGDGPEVWEAQTDTEGREVGRVRTRDKWNNEVFEYKPPEGFQNRPGYDHKDNWVMVTERGEIARTPKGEAIGIQPGQALVFEPDGSVTVLQDEYAQYLFAKAHDTSGTSKPAKSDTGEEANDELFASSPDAGQRRARTDTRNEPSSQTRPDPDAGQQRRTETSAQTRTRAFGTQSKTETPAERVERIERELADAKRELL